MIENDFEGKLCNRYTFISICYWQPYFHLFVVRKFHLQFITYKWIWKHVLQSTQELIGDSRQLLRQMRRLGDQTSCNCLSSDRQQLNKSL